MRVLKQFWWFITFRCYNCGQGMDHRFGLLSPHCPCWFNSHK